MQAGPSLGSALKWSGFAIGAILLVGILVAIVWPLPDMLTSKPSGSLTAAEHFKAANDVRGTLIGLLAGTAAFISVAVGFRTYRLTRSGQFTDRYSRAVDQLGSDKMSIRLGGIFALSQLGRDSPVDRHMISEVLAAMVREAEPISASDGEQTIAPDAQAAVRVLGGRSMTKSSISVDLTGARLPGADLRGLALRRATLTSADLSMAQMQAIDLTQADLSGADLRGACLDRAVLARSMLERTDLRGVDLSRADISHIDLARARRE